VSGARARHLRQVLNAAPGQQVRIGIIDGAYGVGTVQAVGADAVDLRCVFDSTIPERPRVDVLLALPRPKVMRRLWAQLAALGVGRIMVTNAERVERNYFDTHILAPEGYRPLLIEGLQQARDTRLPVVSIHRQFKVLIEDQVDELDGHSERSGPALRLLAHPGADGSIGDAVRKDRRARVLLAIGPEGGWNSFEIRLLETHGFQPVGVGSRTLRTDTAALALLTLAHDAIASRQPA
jgi:RsmE family RNA methyltransferase